MSRPGGEVWVRHADAVAAVDLAQELGLHLLGMEGFLVGETGVYPSMSRIADYSAPGFVGNPYDHAKAQLTGGWADVPDDLHDDAEGDYLIDLVVAG
jgi:hypothetical protein